MEHEKNRREYEKVTEYIYNMIASKEVMAGSRIPSERDIAANLSVSRNSVREAIRMMDSMGVLECRQGAGNFLCGNINRGFRQVLDILSKYNKPDNWIEGYVELCKFMMKNKQFYQRAFEYAGHNSPQQYLLDFYTELFSSADFVNDSKCTYNNPTTSKEMYNVIARLESFAYVGIITEWVNDGMKTDYMAHLEELKALQKTWGTVIAS